MTGNTAGMLKKALDVLNVIRQMKKTLMPINTKGLSLPQSYRQRTAVNVMRTRQRNSRNPIMPMRQNL